MHTKNNIHIFKYSLFSSEMREKTVLTDYEDIIMDVYSEYAPYTTVIVTTDYYLVIGELSLSVILQIGKAFGRRKEFEELFTISGNTSRLFKREAKLSLTRSEFIKISNIYHINEEDG